MAHGDIRHLEDKIKSLGEHYMTNESDVNGFWNAVLNIYFPSDTLEYVANPEAAPGVKSNDRTDLLFYEYKYGAAGAQPTRRPVLYFEGKKSNGDAYPLVKSQLSGYLNSAASLIPTRQTCWAVGARGRTVLFWCFAKGRGGGDPMVPWGVITTNRGVKVGQLPADPTPYDIVNDFNSAHSYLAILDYIKEHPLGPGADLKW